MATIRKRGSSYHVQIRKKGQPTITKSFSSKKSAETWAKDIESKIERSAFTDYKPAETTTLSELLELYRERLLPLRKGKEVEGFRLNTLEAHLGAYKLASLQPFTISKFRDDRLKKAKPATVKRELGLLSSILVHGEKEFGLILPQGNPVTRITQPKEPRGRDRRLQPGELETLLPSFSSPMMQQVVVLAVETGMRRGEITRIETPHINKQSRTLSITKTKTDEPRTIPLSLKAMEALEGLESLSNDSSRLVPVRADSISQAFDRACKRAGIEDLHFHDLRHEATTRFFEKGLNVMEVSSITGHKDLRMLQRYTHLKAEDLVSRL